LSCAGFAKIKGKNVMAFLTVELFSPLIYGVDIPLQLKRNDDLMFVKNANLNFLVLQEKNKEI